MPINRYHTYHPTRRVTYLEHLLIFNTPSTSTHWRVDNFFSAEPETLGWLRRIEPGDVFFDVGANVGVYSIVAAKVHRASVYAFEPEALNYAILNKNVVFNGCGDTVIAYCLAISNELKLDRFNLASYGAGNAMHSFGEAKRSPEGDGEVLESFEPFFRQGAVSFSLDELIARGLPKPRFLKIDVDGFEPRVIEGASKLLASADKLTVLVEVNRNLRAHRDMVDRLQSLSYRRAEYASSVESASSNMIFDRK